MTPHGSVLVSDETIFLDYAEKEKQYTLKQRLHLINSK